MRRPKEGLCIYCGKPATEHWTKTKRGTYIFWHYKCWVNIERYYQEQRILSIAKEDF